MKLIAVPVVTVGAGDCCRPAARGAERRAESPLGRVSTPEEVAAAVVFLASPAATMATGAVLDVNGASYLRM